MKILKFRNKSLSRLLIAIILIFSIFFLFIFSDKDQKKVQHESIKPPGNPSDTIFTESFNFPDGSLPTCWWSEGNIGEIKDGRLHVISDTNSIRVSTIWLDKEIEGNFSIEYDAVVISSSNKSNNINCFVLYSNSADKSLRETKNERMDGQYKKYHSQNGYIFTFLAAGDEEKARFRFRINPGFHLVEEKYGYNCRIGQVYHIKIIKYNNQFQYWVDDYKMMDIKIGSEQPLYQKGLFGFRTYNSTIAWDNLLILKLSSAK